MPRIPGEGKSVRICGREPGLTLARGVGPGHLPERERGQLAIFRRRHQGESRMRTRKVTCLALLIVSAGLRRPLAAQAPAPGNQLSLDVSALAAGLSYAHTTSAGKLVGVGAGVGAEFNIRLVLGEQGGKKSMEIAHVERFTRLQPPGRWQYDVGAKLAADIHSAQVASE